MHGPELGADAASRLERYLQEVLDADSIETAVLQAGLNRTILVETGDGRRTVLRHRNELRDAYYLSTIEREYGVLSALEETSVPAPRPIDYCDSRRIVGEPFVLTTYLDGSVIPLGSTLPDRFQSPSGRERVADELIDTLADIHTLDTTPFEPHCVHRSPADQLSLALDRLDDIAATTDLELDHLRALGERLTETAPPTTGPGLVHGDYRPGNVLFADTPDPVITGVLDWETAILGDPHVDLGYLLLRWRDDHDPPTPLDDVWATDPSEDVLADIEAQNTNGLSPFTSKPGSPTRRELVERYETRSGRTFTHDRFYRAMAAFSLGLVWADLHRERTATGGAGSSEWPAYIAYVTTLGGRIADGDVPL